MEKVLVLLSHIPNPRIIKRIETLQDDFLVNIIFWDRKLPASEQFVVKRYDNYYRIAVPAPQGNVIARIIPLVRFAIKSLSILRQERPAVIHAGNMDMLLIAWIYSFLNYKDVKIVYEIADLPKYTFVKKAKKARERVAKFFQYIERRATKNIRAIILTSPYFWEVYYSDFVDESKYLFLPNAPSKKLFASYEKQKNEIFTIGFIGSVRYVKQLKMLIDAVGEMDKNIKVFIAGSGPGYQVIAEYIKDKPWVEMHGPYNYEQEIVSLYEKVDCVYSVYDTELENVKVALPNRLYEAIVCELPIIAAKGTALGKFIEEKEIGATVGANDKEGLKSILTKWVSDENLIQQYSFSCKLIKEDYYYENNSDKLLELYRNLA